MDVDSETTRRSVDISDLLTSMNLQIAKAKEEAFSRKEILDKLEKWRSASVEEN